MVRHRFPTWEHRVFPFWEVSPVSVISGVSDKFEFMALRKKVLFRFLIACYNDESSARKFTTVSWKRSSNGLDFTGGDGL